jgi:hypothetical protein
MGPSGVLYPISPAVENWLYPPPAEAAAGAREHEADADVQAPRAESEGMPEEPEHCTSSPRPWRSDAGHAGRTRGHAPTV